jgi:hypothetical protein
LPSRPPPVVSRYSRRTNVISPRWACRTTTR